MLEVNGTYPVFKSAGTIVFGADPAVPVPSTFSAGDFLILVVGNINSPAAPSGWTSHPNNGTRLCAYYKTATGTETTTTVTGADASATAVMLAYSSAVIQQTGSHSGNNTGQPSAALKCIYGYRLIHFISNTIATGSGDAVSNNGVDDTDTSIGATMRASFLNNGVNQGLYCGDGVMPQGQWTLAYYADHSSPTASAYESLAFCVTGP